MSPRRRPQDARAEDRRSSSTSATARDWAHRRASTAPPAACRHAVPPRETARLPPAHSRHAWKKQTGRGRQHRCAAPSAGCLAHPARHIFPAPLSDQTCRDGSGRRWQTDGSQLWPARESAAAALQVSAAPAPGLRWRQAACRLLGRRPRAARRPPASPSPCRCGPAPRGGRAELRGEGKILACQQSCSRGRGKSG